MPSINRRQVLQLGGVAALGLGLPELLKAGEGTTCWFTADSNELTPAGMLVYLATALAGLPPT